MNAIKPLNIVIDRFKPQDLPQMLAIWNDVVKAGQAFPQMEPETLSSAEEFFAEQSACCVVRRNGEILGLYILHPNNIGRCGHIANASYAVAETARGLGVGRRLVEHSLKMAKELGFKIMQFNAVTADNAAANGLYPQLGFKPLGSIPGGFLRPDGNYVDINLYYCLL